MKTSLRLVAALLLATFAAGAFAKGHHHHRHGHKHHHGHHAHAAGNHARTH
jgi:hypothetical protein